MATITTTVLARRLGLTNQAVRSRAKRLGLTACQRVGRDDYWTKAQAAKIAVRPRVGRPLLKDMAKYRKKPVVIEALQLTMDDDSHNTILKWIADNGGTAIRIRPDGIRIETLEGEHRASVMDWVIRGVKGEFYPCKPDIFAATYEAVAPQPSDPGYYCDVCPHAMMLHNPDGSCGCGMDCAKIRGRRKAAKP